MTRRTLALTAAALAIAGTIVAQGPRRDGRWQVTIEMQMAGMTMPPQTATQCITPEDAKDPQKAMPQGGRGATPGDCKISDYKVDGNKVTWSMSCARDKMSGSGEFLYSGDTYTGIMKMSAEGQEMTMKYSGKRLGDCTK
jgi:hypothetical protein